MADVRVAIYNPTNPRDPHHWPIHITSPTRRGTIHQVQNDIGGRGYYVAEQRWGVGPERDRLHQTSIFIGNAGWSHVGRVSVSHVGRLRRIVQRMRVDNRSRTWNSQSWILDVVRRLLRLGLLRVSRRGLRRIHARRENWQ